MKKPGHNPGMRTEQGRRGAIYPLTGATSKDRSFIEQIHHSFSMLGMLKPAPDARPRRFVQCFPTLQHQCPPFQPGRQSPAAERSASSPCRDRDFVFSGRKSNAAKPGLGASRMSRHFTSTATGKSIPAHPPISSTSTAKCSFTHPAMCARKASDRGASWCGTNPLPETGSR